MLTTTHQFTTNWGQSLMAPGAIEPEYLYFQLRGEYDEMKLRLFFRQVSQATAVQNCRRVIFDSNMDFDLQNTIDYRNLFLDAGLDDAVHIAWVCSRNDAGRFIAGRLNSQGLLNGKVFPDVDLALTWLERLA